MNLQLIEGETTVEPLDEASSLATARPLDYPALADYALAMALTQRP